MQKKFIFLIIGTVIFLIISIVLIALFTTKPIDKIVNPLRDTIYFATFTPDDQSIFYYDKNSFLKKWDLKNNQVQSWIKFPFSNIDNIIYSPDKSLAIIFWSDPLDSTYEHTWLVDLNNKKIVKEISQNIFNCVWSPDGQKIAVQFRNDETYKYEIDIMKPDGTNSIKVTNFDYDQVDLLWPNQQTLIYLPLPSEATPINVYALNLITGQNMIIVKNTFIENAKDLVGQNKIIFDQLSSDLNTESLAVYDLITNKLSVINKPRLMINKIAQIPNSNSLIAAIRPNKQGSDDIIRIQSNKASEVRPNLPGKIDAKNLLTSNDGKWLYFISGNDFYKMKL